MNLLIIHEIILHEVFCVCLLSLSIVFSRFLRLVADNIPLSWENVEQRKDRIGFALCPSGCHVESGLGGCYEWNSVPQRDMFPNPNPTVWECELNGDWVSADVIRLRNERMVFWIGLYTQ